MYLRYLKHFFEEFDKKTLCWYTNTHHWQQWIISWLAVAVWETLVFVIKAFTYQLFACMDWIIFMIFALLHLCPFAPLHLCSFAPLHLAPLHIAPLHILTRWWWWVVVCGMFLILLIIIIVNNHDVIDIIFSIRFFLKNKKMLQSVVGSMQSPPKVVFQQKSYYR